MCGPSPLRLGQQKHRNLQQRDRDEDEHRPLPATETPGGHDQNQGDGRDGNGVVLGDAQILGSQCDTDKFSDKGKEVQDEQVAHREPAPATTEPLIDQPSVPDSGDRSEANHHLLVHDEDGDQQQEHPEQAVPVALTGLRVGCDAARVVVADHDDDARPQDGGHGGHPRPEGAGLPGITDADLAERTFDIPQVGRIEHSALRLRCLHFELSVRSFRAVDGAVDNAVFTHGATPSGLDAA
ncbi:Uncharacterised protein [Mycobacteroides abscessus subsp. massiliense]|nr:Uncharacterised protein [Mycobacteroides abscessus subsp. massiliense]